MDSKIEMLAARLYKQGLVNRDEKVLIILAVERMEVSQEEFGNLFFPRYARYRKAQEELTD